MHILFVSKCFYLLNSLPQIECDTRSVFKHSIDGFPSGLVPVPWLESLICPAIYSYLGEEKGCIPIFFKGICVKRNTHFCLSLNGLRLQSKIWNLLICHNTFWTGSLGQHKMVCKSITLHTHQIKLCLTFFVP